LAKPYQPSKLSEVTEKALTSAVLLAITIPVFYGAEALMTLHPVAGWLVTRWDAKIPLIPAAVWIYMSWYFAPWLVLAAPTREFRRIAAAIVVAFVSCMICYVLFPAAVERPVIPGPTLSDSALRFLYQHDPPWNIFPSFHAALCAVLWRSANGGLLARRAMQVWMAAICAACLLTKQHNILDIVAGILVGASALVVVTVALRRFPRLAASEANPGD
jgi:hypothetical protein